MSNAQTRPMSIAAFLDWEERQELRYEFDGVRPVAMTGGTAGHDTISNTLRAILRDCLAGSRCRVWGPTTKIEVAGRMRYPDAFVNCVPTARNLTVVPQPGVAFDVLSPGTSRIDRLDKLREYQATPSIERYVLLEQDTIGATVYTRQGEVWIVGTLIDGDTLALAEIDVSVPLAAIYADVDFDDATPADSG